MSCTAMSRFLLCRLTYPVKPSVLLNRNTLCSKSNIDLAKCSYNLLTSTAHRRPYTNMPCGQYRATITYNTIPINKLVPKNSLVLYPELSDLCIITQWRGLRGYPTHRTDRQSSSKTTGTGNTNENKSLKTEVSASPGPTSSEPDVPQKLTLYQRFKKTYKEHGKVLVAVHLITSAAWFGSFYALASCGFDIVPYLENWNFSEKIISPFRSGGLGDVALAYLLYKLATPARYTVTIGGTNLAIKYLRKEGKIPQVAKEDTIRSLYKEGKEDLKQKSKARIRKLRRKNKNKQNGQTQDKL